MAKRKKKRITKWTPLEKVCPKELARVNGLLADNNCPPEDEIWMNSIYQVNVRIVAKGDIRHLSIKRRDKLVIHDWRELQRIKNAIVGPECEAMEIYPAESRLVDTANQFHLWVFTDTEYRIPCGFDYGRVVMDSGDGQDGSKQRAFPKDAKPEDMTTYQNVKRDIEESKE